MTDETHNKVLSLVADIVKKQGNKIGAADSSNYEGENDPAKTSKPYTTVIKGKPKSGRFWKTEKERYVTLQKMFIVFSCNIPN